VSHERRTAGYRRSAQRVFSGPDALEHLAQEFRRKGRPLPDVRTSAQADPRGVDALGGAVVGVFAGVRAHTLKATVEAATAALEASGADSVIAVEGGGSALVTAGRGCEHSARGAILLPHVLDRIPLGPRRRRTSPKASGARHGRRAPGSARS